MRFLALALALSVSASAVSAAPAAYPTPLPEEPIPTVKALPKAWPKSWVVIHDFYFASILDGRLAVVDTTSANQPLKGLVRAAQFANSLVSRQRGEIYTAETFFSRLTRASAPTRSPSGTWKRSSPRARSCCPAASASNR
jgi:methylamine dehydrogenase heavy chain